MGEADALDSWEELRHSVAELEKAVGRSGATHINTQSLKDAAKRMVQQYFRVVRSELSELSVNEEAIGAADIEMQTLLGLANSRNRKSTYVTTLNHLRTHFDEIEIERELRLGQVRSQLPTESPTEISRHFKT
jgi:nitrogenase subunit NifH